MVVLVFADACLADVNLQEGPAGAHDKGAHDMHGNIVLLEPSTSAVCLPDGFTKTDAPRVEASVMSQMRAGRCVIAFFRSGGVLAAQLGHHWHAVVSAALSALRSAFCACSLRPLNSLRPPKPSLSPSVHFLFLPFSLPLSHTHSFSLA